MLTEVMRAIGDAPHRSQKAGHQLRRKVETALLAIASDAKLRALLDLTEDRAPTRHHGWIADTSIEFDHQRFAGFLSRRTVNRASR